jgi:hypothetical protein
MTQTIPLAKVKLVLHFDRDTHPQLAAAADEAQEFLETFLRENEPAPNYWSEPIILEVKPLKSKGTPAMVELTMSSDSPPKSRPITTEAAQSSLLDETWRPFAILRLISAYMDERGKLLRAEYAKLKSTDVGDD